MVLKLAKNVSLPGDTAAAQKYAAIGRSSSGKSYCAGKLIELMLDAGQQVVVVDPVGIHYGLRLGADGSKDDGIKIPVLGGEHGDVILEPTGGKLIADLVVDKGASLVLDVSEMTGGEQARFVEDFATQLLQRKKRSRTPLLVVWEEAQEFVPERVDSRKARMVGAMQRLIKIGRNHGIGTFLITQRPQAVSKDVLNQTEVLFVFQTSGPHERKAIKGWVVEHGLDLEALIEELPSLPQGDGYIWSPQWLRQFERFRCYEKRTFDASATPEFTKKAAKAVELAPIDLEKLGAEMKATIERQKADDPKELRKKIAELKAELASEQSKTSLAESMLGVKEKQKAKPVVLDKDLTRLEKALERAEAFGKTISDDVIGEVEKVFERASIRLGGKLGQVLDPVMKICVAMRDILKDIPREKSDPEVSPKPARGILASPQRVTRLPLPKTAQAVVQTTPDESGNGTLSGPQHRILDSAAWWHAIGIRPSRYQLAFVARYSVNGHFNNEVATLRTEGYLDYPEPGKIELTEKGREAATRPDTPPSLSVFVERVRETLRGGPKRRIFNTAYAVWAGGMESLSRAELANAAGYSVNGHFNNEVSALHSLGVLAYPKPGQIALGEMFEAFR